MPVVNADSYLTLHYRLAIIGGADVVTTFSGNPATLQMGADQLAQPLQDCLMGLEEGAHQTFELAPDAAYGPRNPALLRWVSQATLAENSSPDTSYAVGDLVDFAAPGGGKFAGVLREMGESRALFDFNHPLAGQALQFEVNIIGIL